MNLRDYTIFVVGINSALRVSDIVKLKWKDAFYEIGELKIEIRLIKKKTSKQKVFPINQSIKKAILEYFEYIDKPYDDEYIFKSRQGGNSPLSVKMAWRIFNKHRKASSKLGFSVQLCIIRYTGRTLKKSKQEEK